LSFTTGDLAGGQDISRRDPVKRKACGGEGSSSEGDKLKHVLIREKQKKKQHEISKLVTKV